MIQLTDNLQLNPELPLQQQEQEVTDYIYQYYGRHAVLIPPVNFTGGTYKHDHGYTVFDQFLRPIEVCVIHNSFHIIATRIYADSTTAWRLQSELLTIKTI